MFLTTHAAAGVLISQRFESPWWIFVLSIFVHFIMDFIPHGDEQLYEEWDPRRRKRAALIGLVDFVLVVILVGALYYSVELPRFTLVIAGVGGSLAPDLISHVFPLLHEKYREKFIFRSLGFLKKKVFLLHPLVQRHNSLHYHFHHFLNNFFDYRISTMAGITIQVVIIGVFLVTEFG
ncbi:MAG: hypothetical protein Q8Q20_04805 [bacterium]|nr:hypothetical protein [bacterium]